MYFCPVITYSLCSMCCNVNSFLYITSHTAMQPRLKEPVPRSAWKFEPVIWEFYNGWRFHLVKSCYQPHLSPFNLQAFHNLLNGELGLHHLHHTLHSLGQRFMECPHCEGDICMNVQTLPCYSCGEGFQHQCLPGHEWNLDGVTEACKLFIL